MVESSRVTDGMGRRERKKLRTREALVEAAAALFDRDGYEQVTVAQIAEAADVSTRTFFLHFPAKEDVLVAGTATRIALGVAAIRAVEPTDSPQTALRRAMERMITDTVDHDLPSGLAATRVTLVAHSPALQARLLQRTFEAAEELATALRAAFPDQLDDVEAATVVGAAVGAVSAAALASLRRGDSGEQVSRVMLRAVRTALA